jgi:hypothetical protein
MPSEKLSKPNPLASTPTKIARLTKVRESNPTSPARPREFLQSPSQ